MAKPFVKQVGGKTRLLPQLLEMLPTGFESMRYCEPFVGGGAMFFAVRDRLRWLIDSSPLLCDANAALIEAYRAVRDDVEVLVENLRALEVNHSPDHYTLARNAFNASTDGRTGLSPTERSAIFIYLNKTCFNGVYRVNKSGEFNVPMGDYKNPTVCNADGLREASTALRDTVLHCGDFEAVVLKLLEIKSITNTFIYFDSPYAPVGEQSFTGYTRDGFGAHDQERLRRVFQLADDRGYKLMLSNSPAAAALYDGYRVDVVQAPRSVNSRGGERGLVDEIVVRNY